MSFKRLLEWNARRSPFKRWSDAVFFGLLIITLVVAGQVRDAVEARDDAKECLESSAWVYPSIPSCALSLVESRGRFIDVALAVGQAAAQMVTMASQRGEEFPGAWCTLQIRSMQLYAERSMLSRTVQLLWTDAQAERALYIAARACQRPPASQQR